MGVVQEVGVESSQMDGMLSEVDVVIMRRDDQVESLVVGVQT